MSLFKRTASQVEALEASLNTFLSNDSSAPIQTRKASLTTLQTTYTQLVPVVQKFVTKANAGEADPNKRLYGVAMVSKIRTVSSTLSEISTKLDDTAATVDPLYDSYIAECEAKAHAELLQQMKKKELEEQQKRLEEQKKREQEQARLDMERKKREEEQRRVEQAAAKKREEQRERKLAAEAEAERIRVEQAEKKAVMDKEQEQKRLVAEKAEKERKANPVAPPSSGITLTIKTSKGKSLPLSVPSPTITVADVKKLVAEQHSIPVVAQRLIFQGRLLDDTKPIDSYKIISGCAVHLVENQRAATAAAAATTPSNPSLVVPPGTVCALTGGSREFSRISASCASRVLLVDWSASWCGPCRMLEPVFERLATRFTDVTFVKVDTEASPDNAQLASQKGISSYPTFHFYIDGVIVHQFSGANASGLEAGIRRARTMLTEQSQSQPRTAPSPTPAASSSRALTSRVLAALDRLKNNIPRGDFIVAVRTLLTFVRNVVDHPGQEKYRKVRTANNAFQTRLASKSGGVECMYAFGFEPRVENGENFLVLSADGAANPELSTIRSQLEQALSVHTDAAAPGGGAGAPRAGPTPPNAGAFPAAGGAGAGMGEFADGANMPLLREMMGDPSIVQIAQEVFADPEAMTALMEVQNAVSNGDYAAIERLQNNPALARIQEAIESNPDAMATMLRFMAAHGGMPDMGGGGGGGGGMADLAQMMGHRAGQNVGDGMEGVQMPMQEDGNGEAAIPGAPTTAEEEDRLLQEAIRLSMQDSAAKQRRDEQPKKDEGGGGGQ